MSTSGSPDLIEYDQLTEFFFLCRQCRNHIALAKECFFRDLMANVGIFKSVVNVEVNGPEYYLIEGDDIRVIAVFCKRCNVLLGKKVVELRRDTIALKKGRYVMHLEKLFVWVRSEMLYADTDNPVENE